MAENDPLSLLLVSDDPADFLSAHEDRLRGTSYAVCTDPNELPVMLRSVNPTVVYLLGTPGKSHPRLRPLLEYPTVRWIANSGPEAAVLEGWQADRITVTDNGGVLSDILADYTMDALEAANTKVTELRLQQHGRRNGAAVPDGSLAGKTISVVGLGHVGRAVAERAKSLGMTVVGMRARDIRSPEVDLLLPEERLCNLVARADFISLHVPRTPKTVNLIDKSAFACMGRGTVLLNLSPMSVVDQEGLQEALGNGKVDHAVLARFDDGEAQGAENPFDAREDVSLSPSLIDLIPDWRERLFDAFLDNLDRFKAGLPLVGVVEPNRGY